MNRQPLTIPELTAHLTMSHSAIGMAGEELAARYLERNGYSVRIDHERGDLTAFDDDGVAHWIEVKTSRIHKDKYFHFTLWKHYQGRLRTDHRNAEFVILLCVLRSVRGAAVPFVIPSCDLGNRKAVSIQRFPQNYAGWMASYRQKLEHLHLPDTR
jgi:hypothetical protein